MVDSFFFKQEDNKDSQSECFTFLVACHLKKNKSVDLVIKAFHKAFQKQENVKLIIAGDGEELDNLKKLATKAQEEDRISFFGKYTRKESAKLFGSVDAFVRRCTRLGS